MKEQTAFNAAYSRFKAADQTVGQLAARLEEAHAKRVQAGIDVAAIDREIETFTTSGQFDSKAGAKLVARQTDAGNFLTLLDRSIEHLTRELVTAKASVLKAEMECVDAQLAYHNTVADEGIREFIRANTEKLQKIVRSMHVVTRCSNVRTYGLSEARTMGGYSVEVLFHNVMPQVVANELGDDEAFNEGCETKDTIAIETLHESAHVTSHERALARNGQQTPDGVVVSILKASIPSQPEPFDPTFAFNSARSAAQQAEHHRQRARVYEQKLKEAESNGRFGNLATMKADVESIKASIESHNKQADHYDDIVERWDTRIREHAA